MAQIIFLTPRNLEQIWYSESKGVSLRLLLFLQDPVKSALEEENKIFFSLSEIRFPSSKAYHFMAEQ